MVRPDHLLYINKKSQCKQLGSNINIALKKVAQSSGITVAQAMDKSFMDDTISKDNAYRFLANITGSPAYWEKQKKNIFAMVRQLGIFTMFITLTAAETHWAELLKILKKTVDGEENADVSDLDFPEKSRLIRSDPVTCALYFDHRFHELMNTWKNCDDGPFGEHKILHKYYRIEFQHRGSPHVHMVVWLENAPKFDICDVTTHRKVEEFIDKFVSASSDDPEVADLLKYQNHKCTATCRKKSRDKQTCRFGAPFTPMDRTRVLLPIPEEDKPSEAAKKRYQEIHDRLKEILSDNPASIENFDSLLEILGCGLDEYIEAARYQITACKIFIKRDPKDCRLNVYSKKILMLMRSNMDFQFVLDPYACIGYIVDYINKSCRGLSRLLRACTEDLKRGNFSIRQRLKAVGNTFYNGTEISAQEAAWCRLRLPMSYTSVACEFINTSPRDSRQRMVKSPKELAKIAEKNPDCSEIMKDGWIERYSARPDELNEIALAEFVANYNIVSGNSKVSQNEEEVIDEEEINVAPSNKLKLKDDKGYIRKRRSPKIIRFVRYDLAKDSINFFREQIMLYHPWRDEISEIENKNCEKLYLGNKAEIDQKRKIFTKLDYNIDDILRKLEEQRLLENQQVDDENPEQEAPLVEYDYDETVVRPNIMLDIGQEGTSGDVVKTYSVPDQLSNDEYFELCDTLNAKQRDYLMHMISGFKSKEIPFHHFISGGAGVGKSRLIKAIYQSVVRFYRNIPGPVETMEVVLIAYTGKAAHNIGGMTAHNAFSLVVSQNQSSTKDLTAETLNTLTVKYQNLKLVVIDEISMMGANHLFSIHRRLCQIFRTTKPFGGRSVIFLGDFNQLRPVQDKYAFQPRNDPLAALAGNILWDSFKLFELTEIMRQKDDAIFAQALGRLAEGRLTAEDITMFEERCHISHDHLPSESKSAIHLYSTNVAVDVYNNKRMQEMLNISAPPVISKAVDKVIGASSPRDADQALFALKNMASSQTQGLAEAVTLQVGIRYMISTNIDVQDGIFNGASGILRHIELNQGSPVVMWIEFDDTTVGSKCRSSRQIVRNTLNVPGILTPIPKALRVFKPTKKGQAQISRQQFPVVVAEGITIHKSQGQSMAAVVVDLKGRMDRSLLYVAASRATSLNGLFFIGNFKAPNPPPANHSVVAEMGRMRREAVLTTKFQHLRMKPDNIIQIVSSNVQSIRCHLRSIVNDQVFTKSDIILLQETWALSSETFIVPGFKEIVRNPLQGTPKAYGTMIFVKVS